MKKFLVILALVAGCGTRDGETKNESATSANGAAPSSAASTGPAAATASLTGLYEGPAADTTNQLCMIGTEANEARFGLVVWGGNLHSCLGAGQAVRQGERLTLKMSGDSSCELAATIRGDTITLPVTAPDGCSYYCGARASLAGVALTRKGTTPQDAMKARDLVGDPLCGEAAR